MSQDTPVLPSVLAERYAVDRRIGRGGMATVYLARDRKHERLVALKILHPELSQSLGAERFVREIQIAAQLTHPHILPLYDSGESDGVLYFVMPFVAGESLRDRLTRERQLPIDEALGFTCEVAAALDYAHRQNVLHRDIKPENILIEDGHAVLADFGIARAIGSAAEGRLTETGITVGTPTYMSPEQASAEQVLDGRSDVYSLACVLYEMLAGEPPFTGPTAQTIIAKRLAGPPPRLQPVRPSVSASVEQALARALSVVPADRFRTAGEFRRALAACGPGTAEHESSTGTDRGTRPGAGAAGSGSWWNRLRGTRSPGPGNYHDDLLSRRSMLTVSAAIVAIAVGAAALGPRLFGRGGETVPVIQTLAVLPLTSISGGDEHSYLAEGLTDALIGDLSRIGGIRVISRSSVMMYGNSGAGMSPNAMGPGGMASPAMSPVGMSSDAMSGGMGSGMNVAPMPVSGMSSDAMSSAAGRTMPGGAGAPSGEAGMGGMGAPKSLAQIARELRADVLMQGSVARSGDSVRVWASLTSGATQKRIWSGEYVRHVRDLFALQHELTTTIARVAMRQTQGGATAASAPSVRPVHPAAHQSFLKGAYYQAHWKLADAVASFEQAVQLDPEYAQAYAGISRAYYFMAFFGDVSPGIALGKMQRAAGLALEKDSLLADAHGQMALVKMLHEWNWESAERHFQRALELSPHNAQIRHDYAHFLLAQGRHRASLEQTEQAVALDPANPMLISCLGWHSLFDAQHDQAIAYASESSRMMPDFWAQVVRGWALLGMGQTDSALSALREATRLTNSPFATAALAHGLAVSGHTAEAESLLTALLDRAEREYVSAYDIATVYAGLGRSDDVFRWLRRAADERSTFIVHIGWDTRFSAVRADPRYRELIERRLALPWRWEAGDPVAD